MWPWLNLAICGNLLRAPGTMQAIRHYSIASKTTVGLDNPQETIKSPNLNPEWLAGFFDAEG